MSPPAPSLLIPRAEARAHVLASCGRLAPRDLPLHHALGRVLAEDIVAGEAIPPFANTAMDGFAVRSADTAGAGEATPVVLALVATLAAGAAPTTAVGPGEAIRIMTGAPLPPGADAVVMVEKTAVAADDATVAVLAEVGPGQHIRPAGDDLQPGQPVFASGETLGAGHLGVLASLGRTTVRAVPAARVGVFSTGDELVEGPAPLAPGQIRDSNRITLLSLLTQAGCDAVDLGHARDDEDVIARAVLDGAATCDALLTSGGVSMGDFDYVKVVLDRLGDLRWMQIAIRPAKPFAFGTVTAGTTAAGAPRFVPVFGLPGNPVSSMVSFELFARPGLRQLMGHAPDDLDRPHVVAVADEPLRRRPDGKEHFARVVAGYDERDARYHVRSAGPQGSHHLTAMATANALAILPDGDGVDAGGTVRTMLLAP